MSTNQIFRPQGTKAPVSAFPGQSTPRGRFLSDDEETQVRKKRPTNYIAISEHIYGNSKIRSLPAAAVLRYVFLIAWSKHFRRDGYFDTIAMGATGATQEEIDILVDAGLVEEVDGEYPYLIVGYDEWQSTKDEIDAVAVERSSAGQASGAIRQAQAFERQRLIQEDVPRTITEESSWRHFQAVRKIWPSAAHENETEVYAAYTSAVRTEEEAALVAAAVTAYVRSMRSWSADARRTGAKMKKFLTTGKWRDFAPTSVPQPIPASNDNAAEPQPQTEAGRIAAERTARFAAMAKEGSK